MSEKLKNFLWQPNCQISNLFVVMTVINLILILLLPSSFSFITDDSKGKIRTVQIDAGTKAILFFGYLLGSLIVNYLIIEACKKSSTGLGIVAYILGPIMMFAVTFVLLWLSGKNKAWTKDGFKLIK